MATVPAPNPIHSRADELTGDALLRLRLPFFPASTATWAKRWQDRVRGVWLRALHVTTDAALGAVVGNGAMPRTEVTKKIWAYIKRNGLQDSKNRRAINADDKLRPVFGGKSQVTMFDMTKLVNRHLS